MRCNISFECFSKSNFSALERILCSVVHHELPLNEVETIRSSFVRVANQRIFPLIVECGLAVNHLPCVGGSWDDEGHMKIIRLDELIPEIMTLNHQEIVHGLISNAELQSGPNCRVVQELGSEVVTNEARAIILLVERRRHESWRLCDFEEYPVLHTLIARTDRETREVETFCVCCDWAKE